VGRDTWRRAYHRAVPSQRTREERLEPEPDTMWRRGPARAHHVSHRGFAWVFFRAEDVPRGGVIPHAAIRRLGDHAPHPGGGARDRRSESRCSTYRERDRSGQDHVLEAVACRWARDGAIASCSSTPSVHAGCRSLLYFASDDASRAPPASHREDRPPDDARGPRNPRACSSS